MTNEITMQLLPLAYQAAYEIGKDMQAYATQAVIEDRAQRDAEHLAELRAYELTVANLREQLAQRECKPLTLDEWNRHPYTLALMRSMSEDYVPKTDAQQAVPPKSTSYDEHPYTYASTQATTCAGCGKYKHTPLRIDAMDGYVCLTCIDQKLGSVLGEFGYQAPQVPMTPDEILGIEYVPFALDDSQLTNIVRAVEAHHGIKEKP